MTVLVSNSGTQNRNFTVLIWVPELLPSRSGMVRFDSQVKLARDKGGRKHTSIYMTLFGPSQEKNENPILTQFEPKSTSDACYGG